MTMISHGRFDLETQIHMDSSKSTLLHDSIASTRRRNKTLITIIFFLIISLALIIGGIVLSFVLKYVFKSRSPNTNPAVKEFCAASESILNCSNSLSSSIKTTRHTDPTLVYTLSIEAALQKLSHVDSIVSRSNSDHTRIDSPLGNCWSVLRLAMRGLDGVLAVMRVDPVIETQAFEQRRSMVLLIEKAMEVLGYCGKDLEKAGSPDLDEAGARVQEVEVLLRNSRNFLQSFDWVSANFQANDDYWSTRKILEYVADVSLFGSQYLVLIFLFCLLLRK